jgi:pimeloyl-ACP methyl ester carboxylesterase
MKRGYVETPEGQVHYRTEGSGEPILLLHKAGLSSDEYTEMLPYLGKHFRAIAMDALGYGNTDLPLKEPDFEDYVRNVEHFISTMKLNKINIVGHLLGASFAVEIAAVHPELVKKLVMWDGIFLEPEVRKKTQEEYSKEHIEFKLDGSHLMDIWKSRGTKPDTNLRLAQRSAVEYMKSSLGAASGISHRALFAYDIEPKLPMIKCPTLLIYSKGSALYPRQQAIKRLIPGCQTKEIENAGPFPFWEKAEEISQVITEFLK